MITATTKYEGAQRQNDVTRVLQDDLKNSSTSGGEFHSIPLLNNRKLNDRESHTQSHDTSSFRKGQELSISCLCRL